MAAGRLKESTAADERLFGFSHELFTHANEHRNVFRAMVGKRSGAVIQQQLHKMLVDLARDEVKAIAARSDTGSMPTEAVVQFVAGGLFGLLMWWGNGKMRVPVSGRAQAPFAQQPDFWAEPALPPVGRGRDAPGREVRFPHRIGTVAPRHAVPSAHARSCHYRLV